MAPHKIMPHSFLHCLGMYELVWGSGQTETLTTIYVHTHIQTINVYIHTYTHLLHICMCVCVYHSMCMRVREQLIGVSCLLPPYGFWVSNSGHQAWQEASLLTKPPFHQLTTFAFISSSSKWISQSQLHLLFLTIPWEMNQKIIIL